MQLEINKTSKGIIIKLPPEIKEMVNNISTFFNILSGKIAKKKEN